MIRLIRFPINKAKQQYTRKNTVYKRLILKKEYMYCVLEYMQEKNL